MPKSKKRTKKKTSNIAKFQRRILEEAPSHVLERQLLRQMPWLTSLPEAERNEALHEISDLTIAATGGNTTSATHLQQAIDYWQNIAELPHNDTTNQRTR